MMQGLENSVSKTIQDRVNLEFNHHLLKMFTCPQKPNMVACFTSKNTSPKPLLLAKKLKSSSTYHKKMWTPTIDKMNFRT